MRIPTKCLAVLILVAASTLHAQTVASPEGESFADAAKDIHRHLEESLAELAQLREQVAAEKIPLSRQLNELEGELLEARLKQQQTQRVLDSRMLDRGNISNEIKFRKEETVYLSNLLGEYIRNFESRLHIAELQRYRELLDEARLAADSNRAEQEVFQSQAALVAASLDRLEELLGGARFEGTAVDSSGQVRNGTYVLLGPAAIFRTADGATVGTAEQRLGSLEPTIFTFESPENVEAAAQLVTSAAGYIPLDPTLGNAHKIESTEETLWEHIQKGGPVMIPIFALAAAAVAVALIKWLGLAFRRKPSQKRIKELLEAVAHGHEQAALEKAKAIRGPVGTMLYAGAMHLNEPRELIEEVMYESVLATKLKLQRLLPFIAISAAAAPLLGLLGTVTGIINTFKLITVFGTGDVKTLSGGISEALITTEFGLIVAIPSLLLHALLSRKARGIVDQMEKNAITFVNHVSKSPFGRRTAAAHSAALAQPSLVAQPPGSSAAPSAEQIEDIVTEVLITRGVEAIRDRKRPSVPARHESLQHPRSVSAAREEALAGARSSNSNPDQ